MEQQLGNSDLQTQCESWVCEGDLVAGLRSVALWQAHRGEGVHKDMEEQDHVDIYSKATES